MGILNAGAIDRRVRIERAGADDNGYNEVDVWGELATVWAQYLPARGQEAREALGREATAPATFRVRWQRLLGDLGAGDRLVFPIGEGARVYDIKSVTEMGRREGLEIVAVAGDG
ncbi:MAG: head-tail adaptor protein [Sphingomonas bacterium]|nr:head-tail adaptor protein [Sphingomonas bacterium]